MAVAAIPPRHPAIHSRQELGTHAGASGLLQMQHIPLQGRHKLVVGGYMYLHSQYLKWPLCSPFRRALLGLLSYPVID